MIASAVVGFADGHRVVCKVDIAVVACVLGLSVLERCVNPYPRKEEPTEECKFVSKGTQDSEAGATYIWAY